MVLSVSPPKIFTNWSSQLLICLIFPLFLVDNDKHVQIYVYVPLKTIEHSAQGRKVQLHLLFSCSFCILFIRMKTTIKFRFKVKRSHHFLLQNCTLSRLNPTCKVSLYYWLIRSEVNTIISDDTRMSYSNVII